MRLRLRRTTNVWIGTVAATVGQAKTTHPEPSRTHGIGPRDVLRETGSVLAAWHFGLAKTNGVLRSTSLTRPFSTLPSAALPQALRLSFVATAACG